MKSRILAILLLVLSVIAVVLYWIPGNGVWVISVLQVLAGYMVVPLLVGVLILIWNGHYRSSLVSAVLVAVILGTYYFSPSYHKLQFWWESQASAAGNQLTVLSANVQFGRGDSSVIAKQAEQIKADAVVIVEATGSFARQVDPKFLEAYPYRTSTPVNESGYEVWILSRLPFTSSSELAELTHSQTVFHIPVVSVETASGPIQLIGVHLMPPVPGGAKQWNKELRLLHEWVQAQSTPVIAAGDFNAAYVHPEFRILAKNALDSADVGSWWKPQPTWPSMVPFTRIDHVLTWQGSPIVAGSFEIPGSDHLGVWGTAKFPVR